MSVLLGLQIRRKEWSLTLVPVITLLFYLFYVISYVFLTPYPGVFFSEQALGWRVTDSTQPVLRVGDIMVQIGDLTVQDYQADRFRTPFSEYEPGDSVPISLLGINDTVVLQMPQPTFVDRLKRLASTLAALPFWIAGTAVLMFLRPRDMRWS
ncbi:MAG: hypothetical protein KC425_26130, partial [Anaerolineales bacterium]|nr:hypothetical protein [Anaerolineales bacterium]